MKEDLSVVSITNPTSEDFTWNYNGEPYTIKAGETTGFSKPIAFHLAKHLSTKMVVESETKKMTKKDLENSVAKIHFKIAQLGTADTTERRIALYKIFGDENIVIQMIQAYPFKSFIGNMEEYRDFVNKSKSKGVKSTE